MRRREFVMLASGYATMWSLPAEAQQAALPRIGLLLVGLSPESKAAQHFRRGLRDAGYIEGRNIIIEWRYAQGDYGRISAFIDEFVRSNIDVMVMDRPDFMALVLDPVGSGLIQSLARPGGNVTGLSMMTTVELNSKRLELLKAMIPKLSHVAVMWNPDHPLHHREVDNLKAKSTVPVNRAEFRGRPSGRAARTHLLGYQREKGSGAIRYRRPAVLCPTGDASGTRSSGQTANAPRLETISGGRCSHVLWAEPL